MPDQITVRDAEKALKVTQASIARRAKKENWSYIEETIRGGSRRLYMLDKLPAYVQDAIRHTRALEAAQNQVQKPVPDVLPAAARSAEEFAEIERQNQLHKQQQRRQNKEANLAKWQALPDDKPKRGAKAKAWLVNAYWKYWKTNGGSKAHARYAFATAVNCGDIKLPEEHAEYLPKYDQLCQLSAASLQRWELDFLNGGHFALVNEYGKRKGQSIIETTPKLKEIVLGAMTRHPHIKAKHLREYLEAAHPEYADISDRTIDRFKQQWIKDNHQTWTFMTNPDQWKNVYMVAYGSHHENIIALNQLWEMDSTPADFMLIDGRHSVVGAIDLYSRRLMFYVSKSSSAYAVSQTFRRAVLAWGLPDAVRTDNGKDYVSVHFNTVLKDLEIDHPLCVPFASEEKGTIERAMRTMSHSVLELLDGFIGHNVADRKQIEARKSFSDRIMKRDEVIDIKMTAADLQEKLDQWTEYLYGRDPHSGLNGKSPWEVANAWTQPIRRITNERALDALLAPVNGVRTIGKKGINIDNNQYIASELFAYSGQVCSVKIDEGDIGRAYVYVDGEFICIAECPELTGISRKEVASASKAAQKKHQAEQAAETRHFQKHLRKNMADTVIQHRIEQSENVTELPKRFVDYTTPALDEAARAMDLPAWATSEPVDTVDNVITFESRTLSRHQQLLADGDMHDLYVYWHELDDKQRDGETLNDNELRWYRSFRNSSDYVGGEGVAELRGTAINKKAALSGGE
jgi:putative transposase